MSSPAQIFAGDLAKLSEEVHGLACRTEEMGETLPSGPARSQLARAAALLYDAANWIEHLEPDDDDRGDVEHERRRDEGSRL